MTENTPAQFDNVSVVTKANVFFDGKVISHTILFPDGSRKSIGIMFPGEYEFNVGASERMEVTDGSCRAMIAGETGWKTYPAGTSFHIAENSSFKIEIDGKPMQYICSFGV